MKKRIFWIKWKLMDLLLATYIKIHRIGRKIGRKWSERKGSKTTWADVFKLMDKIRQHDRKYFDRLGRWSDKSYEYWVSYMSLKYK